MNKSLTRLLLGYVGRSYAERPTYLLQISKAQRRRGSSRAGIRGAYAEAMNRAPGRQRLRRCHLKARSDVIPLSPLPSVLEISGLWTAAYHFIPPGSCPFEDPTVQI
jgi:hypothetical protein